MGSSSEWASLTITDELAPLLDRNVSFDWGAGGGADEDLTFSLNLSASDSNLLGAALGRITVTAPPSPRRSPRRAAATAASPKTAAPPPRVQRKITIRAGGRLRRPLRAIASKQAAGLCSLLFCRLLPGTIAALVVGIGVSHARSRGVLGVPSTRAALTGTHGAAPVNCRD